MQLPFPLISLYVYHIHGSWNIGSSRLRGKLVQARLKIGLQNSAPSQILSAYPSEIESIRA